MFKDNRRIYLLFAASADIAKIEDLAFQKQTSLYYIFLDGNKLTVITRHMFTGPKYLMYLSLTNNPLNVIEKGAFKQMKGLETIYLINTNLHTIDIGSSFGAPGMNIVFSIKDTEMGMMFFNLVRPFLKSSGYTCIEHEVPFDLCLPCDQGHYKTNAYGELGCQECPAGGRPNKMAEKKRRESTGEDFEDRNHVDSLKREHFLKPDSDQIDLNLLLKAVLDISEKLDRDKVKENEGDLEKLTTSTRHETTGSKEGTIEFDRHSLASTSRSRPRSNYRYSGPRKVAPPERKNMSFSNNKVMDIDRENQRLLKKITSTRARPKSAAPSTQRAFVEPMRVQTAAEVNRARFQRKVDEDNQKLLQRLQSVKPTKSLSKDYLSKEAAAQKQYMPSRSRPSSAVSTISRRPRMTHAGSASSLMSSDVASVASSRVSRASSASRRSRKRKEFPKPVWESGW